MNYEERYKQAIEAAKKELHCCGSLNCDAARQIFRFFPELRESEDERIRSFLIDFIKACRWAEKEDQGWPSKEECIAWLEKQGEQPSWSEEDDIRLNNLIGFIQKYGLEYYASIDKVIDFIHWLKSLRPQSHWKPSEEQMEALKNRTHGLHTSSETRKALESLINDLEKL